MLAEEIILKPIVTEKTSNMSLIKNVYVFEVSLDATKIDIKKAIKELYWVEVSNVNIVNTREKVRFGRKGGIQLRKRASKKAYVSLKNPQDKIDYTIVK